MPEGTLIQRLQGIFSNFGLFEGSRSGEKTFSYQQGNFPSKKDLPTINIDVNTGQAYLPAGFGAVSGGNGPGFDVIKDKMTGAPTADYLTYAKTFATPDDPLGVNNASKKAGGGDVVSYAPIASYNLEWLPTNGAVLFKDGKIQSVTDSQGVNRPFTEVLASTKKAQQAAANPPKKLWGV